MNSKPNPPQSGARIDRSAGATTPQIPPAKWLNESGRTAPPAFFVPIDEPAEQFVKAGPDGTEGGKRVREWAVSDFHSRFAGLLERFTEDRIIATDGREDCDKRIKLDREARDNLEKHVTYTATALHFPCGTQGRYMLFLAALFCGLILLEWLNMAGFAARAEMQSMLAGLGYTFSAALIPLALEFAFFDRSRLRRILSVVLICLAGFFFMHLFSDAYVTTNPNATSEEILSQSNTPTPVAVLRFWNDPLNPHWRLVWQWLLAASVGMAFARFLASQITVITVTESKPNPEFGKIEELLLELLEEREEWGERFAEAEGNIKEWEESEKLHVAWRVWLFEKEQRRRRLFKEARELLLKEADEASAPSSFWNRQENHNRRIKP